MKKLLCISALLLAGCAGTGGERPASVERMYVISCGENHVKDLSRWTTPADAGKAWVFSDYCYLIKHAKGWMLWDTGNPDRLASLPNGLTAPNGIITAFMQKPLVDSLREIGVAPADIQNFAMSHSHGDHSGNANLFGASTLYMQTAEYDAVFGPEPQKYGFIAANFEKLRGAKTVKLNGEYDVFGDGSVVIKPTPGHTPGHQSLVVRLPKSGLVVLSGDLAHQMSNWEAKRAPSFNFSVEQSVRSMQETQAFMDRTGAKIWINHDKEHNASIPKAPAYVE
jgi:glyoxylase-like metal-dependent hydrolase (beta-lactamase superfamily II)